MAGQIRITPEQMNARANQYRGQADAVNAVIAKMDSLLHMLQGEWEGAASQAYFARFMELRPGFVKAEELIREIAASLDTAAMKLSEADQAIAGAFGAGG